MAENYSAKDVQSMSFIELIRLRPGMYLGSIELNGFINLIKECFISSFEEFESDTIILEFSTLGKMKLSFQGGTQIFHKSTFEKWTKKNRRSALNLAVLNALCKELKINVSNNKGKELYGIYEKGVFLGGTIPIKETHFRNIDLEFILDDSIWIDNKNWKPNIIAEHLKEVAFLFSDKTLLVKYPVGDMKSNIIYQYKDGLNDRLSLEIIRGLGSISFRSHIVQKVGKISLEVAFAFKNYSVDQPKIISYANYTHTSEHGSHVQGLLKGLTFGVMKYFQKHGLTHDYKISQKGIKENLIAIIHIKMDNAIYSGCTKNKLANPEIIEPIQKVISELLFKKIEENKEDTENLISKFKI